MQILLNESEQLIDEALPKKELSYFMSGEIIYFVALSYREYDAIVSGTEDDKVQLIVSSHIFTQRVY